MMPTSTLTGIEMQTMIVLRQLPTNASTMSATRPAARIGLAEDALHGAAHEASIDRNRASAPCPPARSAWSAGSMSRVASTTASVDAFSFFRIAR